jgi:hypothetical protein
MTEDPFFLDDARDLDHACEVISEDGCYAGNAITDEGEFDRVDREGRVAVAAKDLEAWVRQFTDWHGEPKADSVDIKVTTRLIAKAMLRQHDRDEKARVEHRGPAHRWPPTPAHEPRPPPTGACSS